jgi:hypothetical protein
MDFPGNTNTVINKMKQKSRLLEKLSLEQHESLAMINRQAARVYFELKDKQSLSEVEKEYLEFAWTVIDMTENPYGDTGDIVGKLTREFRMPFKKEN